MSMQTREERQELFRLIGSIKDAVDTLTDICRPMFDGNRYISDTELARRLCVSKRTLANYRASGKIGYYLIQGKILYAESEVEDLLKGNYLPPLI